MRKPVIGITCNFTSGTEEEKATFNIYTPYAVAIQASGGIAQLIPHSPKSGIPEMLDLYDGLLLSGGGGLPPHIAQMEKLPGLYEQNPVRHEFDLALTEAALERKMPILGVCRGQQTINDVLGGSLINIEGGAHLQKHPGSVSSHGIKVEPGSLLFECCQTLSTYVNSFHQQAVSRPGRGLKVTAHASDGIVECIEGEEYPFLMGVQFHPEYMIDNDQGMARIYSRLVKEAAKYKLDRVLNN